MFSRQRQINPSMGKGNLTTGWLRVVFPSGATHYIYTQDSSEYECDYTVFELVNGKAHEVDGGVISMDFDDVDLDELLRFAYGEFDDAFNPSKISAAYMLDDGMIIEEFDEGIEFIEKGA